MLAVRSLRALGVPGAAGAVPCRRKATAVAQPKTHQRLDQDEEGAQEGPVRGAGKAMLSKQHQELLDQLQEHEIRIPMPWGHVAGKWWGRRDRRPLVALHGWGDNAGSFERLASSLRGVPVLALDLPGHGLSSRVPRGLPPADRGLLLAALRRVQRALGATSLSLVGHSLGDVVALMYAASFPTDVDMYVSLDPLAPAPLDADSEVKTAGGHVDELLDAEDSLFHSPKTMSRVELMGQMISSRGGSISRHGAETLLRRGAQGSDEGALSLTLDPRVTRTAVLSPSLALAAARSVRCPTLAVIPQWRGPRALSADPDLRERMLADLRMAAKTLTTVKVDGTHHVHLNNPEVVVPALQDFLDTHRSASQQQLQVDKFIV